MIRRKRGALGSVFLPAWQGWRTQFARAGNNRSRLAGLLSRRNTASHRCFLARIQGAPPRSAPGRTPGCRLFPPLTLPSERIVKNKKRETPACLPPKGRNPSYGGISSLSARFSGLPCFCRKIIYPSPAACQARRRFFRQNIPQTLANRRRAVYNFAVVNRGACRSGLRGGWPAPTHDLIWIMPT